jgi:hypothetical protein
MKFISLLESIIYLYESIDEAKKIFDQFNEIDFNSFLKDSNSVNGKKAKQQIEDFEKMFLDDKQVDLSDAIHIQTFNASFAHSSALVDEKNLLDAEEITKREKDFPSAFFNMVITNPILNKKERQSYMKRLEEIEIQNLEFQKKEIERYENKIIMEKQRYSKREEDILASNLPEDKKQEELQKNKKFERQTITNIEENIKEARYLEKSLNNQSMIEMAREIIKDKTGSAKYAVSEFKSKMLIDLIKKKTENEQLNKLLNAQKEYLLKIDKDTKEKERKDKLQSAYGITKSKTLSTASTASVPSSNIKVSLADKKSIGWDNLKPQDRINKWEEYKPAIIDGWNKVKDVFDSIKSSSLNTGYYNLSDENKIFYSIFKERKNNLDNNDVSDATYEKILTKTFLALLPPSIISKIKKENTSKNPEKILQKINSVLSQIEKGTLVPKEIEDAQKDLNKIKTSVLSPSKIKEQEDEKIFNKMLKKEQEDEDELDKLIELEQEEKDKESNLFDDFIKKIEFIKSGVTSQNVIYQTINNLRNFIVKLKVSKTPSKSRLYYLNFLELSIDELDPNIIGLEDIKENIKSSRSYIEKNEKI